MWARLAADHPLAKGKAKVLQCRRRWSDGSWVVSLEGDRWSSWRADELEMADGSDAPDASDPFMGAAAASAASPSRAPGGRPFKRGDLVRLVEAHPLLGLPEAAEAGIPTDAAMPSLVTPEQGPRLRQALRLGLGVHGTAARVRRFASKDAEAYRLDRTSATNAALMEDARSMLAADRASSLPPSCAVQGTHHMGQATPETGKLADGLGERGSAWVPRSMGRGGLRRALEARLSAQGRSMRRTTLGLGGAVTFGA